MEDACISGFISNTVLTNYKLLKGPEFTEGIKIRKDKKIEIWLVQDASNIVQNIVL